MSLSYKAYALFAILTLLLGTGMKSLALAPKHEVEAEVIYAPVDLNLKSVEWVRCSSWNAFYYHDNHIEMCENNLKLGVPVARWVLLHEMGHAFTFTRKFTYERWGGNYEAAADEYAAVQSIVRGHKEDLLAMARVLDALGGEYDPNDPHPTGVQRAARLRELYRAYLSEGPQAAPWREALEFWREKIAQDLGLEEASWKH